MEYIKTPIGRVEMLLSTEKELNALSDEALLEKAVRENKEFCISPATYRMIEKRFLDGTLQNMINPHVGVNKLTSSLTSNW